MNSDNGSVHIKVGPVASSAARAWTRHQLTNLEILAANANALPFRLPPDVVVAFADLLTEWRDHADIGEPFVWEADLEPHAVHVLVQYWANLDSLTPEHLETFGIEWSNDDARPFFGALAHAVAEAFEREGKCDPFATLLATRADQVG